MTFDLATALLNRAANGNELLTILDSIVADNGNPDPQPTAEEIQF